MATTPPNGSLYDTEPTVAPTLTLEDFLEAQKAGLLRYGTVLVTQDPDLEGGRWYIGESLYGYVKVEGMSDPCDYVLQKMVIDRETLIPIPGFPDGRLWGVIYDEIEAYGPGWGVRRVLAAQQEALSGAVEYVYGEGAIVGTAEELFPLVKQPILQSQTGSAPWVLQPYSEFVGSFPQDRGYDYKIERVPFESGEV